MIVLSCLAHLLYAGIIICYFLAFFLSYYGVSYRINEEFEAVRLTDLRVLATLGVGGFGRVELVQIQGDANRSFALKQMKKSQV